MRIRHLPVLIALVPTLALAAERPNILFAIADDASYPHFSAYGCKFVKTPAFDRVAREGVLFTNAFTPIPKCSPSRATVLTGQYPWRLEEAFDHNGVFPSKFAVYPDILESAGYFVGFTGKPWSPGSWEKGGWKRNPVGPEFNQHKNAPPTPRISNTDYAANFGDFLSKRPKGKPFCFWYGGHEPHRPYALGTGLKAGKNLADVIIRPYFPDVEIIRSDILDYGFEIEWFDAHLGRILKKLDEIGELDNTLIVVTSDNGMPFPRCKGHMFEDACHMPLAIRWGKEINKPGRTCDDFVSFIDYAPTFLEAAGLPVRPEMSGRSLLNIFKSDATGTIDPARDRIYLGRERTDIGRPNDVGFPVRCVRTKEFWYSHNFAPDRWPCGDPETGYRDTDDSPTKSLLIEQHAKGDDKYYNLAMAKRPAEELYDLKKDPSCAVNVADDPAYAQVKAQLWSDLQAKLKETKDPRIEGKGDAFDQYKYEGPRRDGEGGAKKKDKAK